MNLKKNLLIPTIIVALISSSSLSVHAQNQTVVLAPTNATIGHAIVDTVGDFGGGVSNVGNSLALDGQTATFDPSSPGPGPGPDYGDSYIFLDYQKDKICPEATINSVTVHAYWSQSGNVAENDAAAALFIPESSGTLHASFTPPSTFAQTDTSFGGLVSSQYMTSGTYSGNPPITLTHESMTTQVTPNYSELTDADSRIVVTIGEQYPVLTTGELDYAYLEVNYNDSDCYPSTSQVDTTQSTPTPPKTGIEVGIIIATSIAISSIFLTFVVAKKLKLRH